MKYLCGFTFWQEAGVYYANSEAMPNFWADGETLDELFTNAYDVFALLLADSTEGANVFLDGMNGCMQVDISPEQVDLMHCMTNAEAAEELGVSPSRVSQLIASGALDTITISGRKLITIESVNKRLASKRKAGRPKQVAA